MKVLVTGVRGQLGYDVLRVFSGAGHDVFGTDYEELDFTNEDSVNSVITEYKPDVVVHCGAYTAVDNAEDDREKAYNVNVNGTRYIANACKKVDAKMIYISTDYVFDGQGEEAFLPEDEKNPVNYYGETKGLGEEAVRAVLEKYFIVRISWVFGVNGKNFVKTMLRLGSEKESLTVVDDQIGSPTYTYDLAELLLSMIDTKKYGIYHATNEGYCSWCEFAKEIMKLAKLDCKVEAVTSDQYPTKAKRPKNSRMSKDKLEENGFERLRDWKIALEEYIKELEK